MTAQSPDQRSAARALFAILLRAGFVYVAFFYSFMFRTVLFPNSQAETVSHRSVGRSGPRLACRAFKEHLRRRPRARPLTRSAWRK
jgi:hypothetical protein